MGKKKAAEKKISDRKLGQMLGISHTMVRKYRQRGMPATTEQAALAWLVEHSVGRFAAEDPDQASGADIVAELEGRASRDDKVSGDDDSEPVGPAEAGELAGVSQADLTKRLTAARIRLTNRDAEIRRLQGRQAQLDADLRDGRLRPAEEVRRVNTVASIALRDRLLSLPSELAVRLGAMTEPAEIAALLRESLKGALNEWLAAIGAPAGD